MGLDIFEWLSQFGDQPHGKNIIEYLDEPEANKWKQHLKHYRPTDLRGQGRRRKRQMIQHVRSFYKKPRYRMIRALRKSRFVPRHVNRQHMYRMSHAARARPDHSSNLFSVFN